MVPQFETCGTEIHPEFIQHFLPRFDVSIFPSCGFRCLRSLNSLPGLFTVPLRRMTDLLSRPCFVLLSSIYAVFLILFLVSSLEE